MEQEVHYMVTTDDVAHLSHHISQHTPIFRRRRRVGGALVGLSGLLFFASLPMSVFSVACLFAIMLTSVWMMFGVSTRPNDKLKRYFQRIYEGGRNRGVLGPHSMKLLEDHLEIRTPYTYSSMSWEVIDRIEEDNDYIFIFVSALNAHVITKKSFPNPLALQAFMQRARALHERALQLELQHHGNHLPALMSMHTPPSGAMLHLPPAYPTPTPQHYTPHPPRTSYTTPTTQDWPPQSSGTDGSV